MPKVSVNILTKNRAERLKKALESVLAQGFKDFEVIVVNDGSTDTTAEVLKNFASVLDLKIISHNLSLGITQSRQEALALSTGDYVAILDDDDVWLNPNKLKKQAEFLDHNPNCVLTGGGMEIDGDENSCMGKFRPQSDRAIRSSMLFKNNFFTSTAMFRRGAAIQAGGFISRGADLAEDYDLWLRLGLLGQFYNFHEVFTLYAKPKYNKERFKRFLQKQLMLIAKYKNDYPGFYLASLILRLRLIF
ncbi:MAG: glycosyltransferase family A protein [Candidatus Doudnabacteria bacterium]|nr:glycosyltransferase family A protein [Candidatus Doudnabacteria bacterium]